MNRAFRNTDIPLRGADPYAYAGVALLLAFVALAAMLIPASRASAVDPLTATSERKSPG